MRGYRPCVAQEQYEKERSEASAIHHSGKCVEATSRVKLSEAIFNAGTSEERKIIN